MEENNHFMETKNTILSKIDMTRNEFWKVRINKIEASPHYEEIKKYWEENFRELNSQQMWDNFVGQFFGEGDEKRKAFFIWQRVAWVWKKKNADSVPISKKEEERQKLENRTMAIRTLNRLLRKLEKEEKNIQIEKLIDKVLRLYEIIRREEDSEKNLELRQHKESRETALTVFQLATQYGNVQLEDIQKLKEIVNEQKSYRQHNIELQEPSDRTTGDTDAGDGSDSVG